MLTLMVKVKPNARQQAITQRPDGTWAIHLNAPPLEGNANRP